MLSGLGLSMPEPDCKQVKCALLLQSLHSTSLSLERRDFCTRQTEHTPPDVSWGIGSSCSISSALTPSSPSDIRLPSLSVFPPICFLIVLLLREPTGRPLLRLLGKLLSEGSKTFFAILRLSPTLTPAFLVLLLVGALFEAPPPLFLGRPLARCGDDLVDELADEVI